MKDCIRLYQNYIDVRKNSFFSWETLEHDLGLEKFLCVDQNVICDIINALKIIKGNNTPIQFLEEPNQIPCLLEAKEPVDLVNIDYFHDIYEGNCSRVKDFEEYDNKSWVGYMTFHKNLSSYTWGKLPTSPDFTDVENFIADFAVNSYKEVFDSIKATHFDKCIVCYSGHYIPYKFYFVWLMIKTMFNGGTI